MYIRTYKCVIDWVKPVGLHKIPYTNDHSIIEAVLRGKHLTQHYLAEMAFKLLGLTGRSPGHLDDNDSV